MRKLWRKLLTRLFGECYVKGHWWKMQHDGWQMNDKFDGFHDFSEPTVYYPPFTKKWIYYRCRRKGCEAMAE